MDIRKFLHAIFTPKRLLALIMALSMAATGGGIVSANLSGSTFEGNDGNMVVNTSGNTDWANVAGLNTGIDKASGSNDNAFGQGTKEDNPAVTIVTGSIPPNKNDLTRFYEASERVSNGDIFLYLGWERLVNIGNANLDFEINQAVTPAFTTSATGPLTINRTAGDVLITYDFGGSGTPTLGLNFWLTAAAGNTASQCFSANSLPCWGLHVNLNGADSEGAVNTVQIAEPIAGGNLGVGLFGEAAINLTQAGVFKSNVCETFGSTFVKSRSSSSFSAEIKDFIAPIPVNISNCGKIRVQKVTVPSPDTSNTSFPFTLTGSSALNTNLPASFSLTNGKYQDTQVFAGSGYAVAETVPSGWTQTSAVCDNGSPVTNITVNINQLVTCTFTNTAQGSLVVKKVTVPASDTTTSFSFTAGGGLTPGTFSLKNGDSQTYSNLAPGSGYSVAESSLTGWDLTSAVCDNGSLVSNISIAAGQKVTCTFTNTQRGAISIHKVDDAGNVLQGAVFTATPGGATCTTDASGNCTIGNLVPGSYTVTETTTPAGYTTADPQTATVGAGATVTLNFTDPRQFKIIVLVCQLSNNTLYPSSVTVDGATLTSLASGGGGTITDAALCGLGGAAYAPKGTGSHTANVTIPQ